MKYMGSKARHAKHILPIILKDRKPGQWYVEPFVGGANTFHLVSGKKLANDSNQYLMSLLEAVGKGWKPPLEISESEYNVAKMLPEYMNNETIGFIGIGCSYGGKWFGGYARGNDSKGNPRNYAEESAKNILKQAGGLNAVYQSGDYRDLNIPESSLIYCDPPYANATKYKDAFDHSEFWRWCNEKVDEGHTVFVSEYNAPSDWTCVWQKEVTSSLTKNTGAKKATEKLFTKLPTNHKTENE